MVGNPPSRAGGFGKGGLLPNKFVPPGVAKLIGSTSTNSHNSSSGENSSGHSASGGGQLTDEQRLNIAYGQYLQSQAMFLIMQKVAEVKNMVGEQELLTATLKSDYSKGFIQLNSESSLYYNRILVLKRLLHTNGFLALYTSLEQKFLAESCTMGELQKALGAKFDNLELQNLDGLGDVEETEMDIDELVNQVKRHLTPDAPGKPVKDGKSFLLMFTQALRGVISDASAVEKEKTDGEAVDSGLWRLNSLKMSDKMVSRVEDNNENEV